MLLAFSACCLMSSFLGRVSGKKHKTSEILIQMRYVLIFNPNYSYIFVHVDLSHTAAEKGIDGGLRTADSDEHN